MKHRLQNIVNPFLIALPIVFAVLFFGYLKPSFDIVVYTGNISGEGSCSTYISSDSQPFAYLYKADAYFGSELKTLRIRDLRYDINTLTLSLYGIEEADILSYDISVFGWTVLHHNSEGDQTVFRPITLTAVESNEKSIGHIHNENPENVFTVSFVKSIGIPKWIWVCYFVFIFLIALLFAFGIYAALKSVPSLKLPLIGISSLLAAMIAGCYFCGSFPYVDYTDFLLNFLLLFSAGLLLGAITQPWIGSCIITLLTLFWYSANYYVISFRNKPVMPADLKALGTAEEVVSSYDLTPPVSMIIGILIVLCYVAILVVLAVKDQKGRKDIPLKKNLIRRGGTVLVAAALIFLSVNNRAFASLNSFQWDNKVLEGFHREGMVLTFVNSALNAHVPRPESYSREVVTDYLREYEEKEPLSLEGSVQPQRIIMIMNEAFSDLRTVGMDEQIDVMPFIDSLKENTVKGNLYVSVIGGGTCNTEFEALTGNTMAFLGAGAYPFTENVTRPTFSLAKYFADYGFLAEAFHPSEADNWNRSRVYPFLGFSRFHSIEDYTELAILHNYVSDQSDYRYLMQEDAKHSGTNRFMFNVTIQNHADYDHFQDVKEDVSVQSYGAELREPARVYLSLIKASDDAVKEMVETYRDSDERTMIIFFGDHQPCFSSEAMERVYNNVGSMLDYYKTKFFIWTNYEMESVEDMEISANYLPWLVLKCGNFPLPPYVQMLEEVHNEYPILTSQGVFSIADGSIYTSVQDLLENPVLRKYQCVQYANLFDEIDDEWFRNK